MTVQEVARCVMKVTGMSQAEVAKKAGLTGQSTVSMFLQSKSMRVDNLVTILNACGYELVARSREEGYPEYIIGNETKAKERAVYDDKRIEEIVRKAVAEALTERNGGTLPEDI